jgi:hypothetical protein
MKRLWRTSTDVIASFTGFPAGSRSSPLVAPFSYSNPQDHMRAVTFTSMASGGTVRLKTKPFQPT